MLVAENNRPRRDCFRAGEEAHPRAHVRWLEKEISRTDGELEEDIEQSPTWRADEALLRSVPGVGPVLARILFAELPELGVLSASVSAHWWEWRL